MAELRYDSAASAIKGFEEKPKAGNERFEIDANGQLYGGLLNNLDGAAPAAQLSAGTQSAVAGDAVQLNVFNGAIADHGADNEESEAAGDNLDDDANRGKTLRALCYALAAIGAMIVAAGVTVGGYFGIVALTKAKNASKKNDADAAEAPVPTGQTVQVPHDKSVAIELSATHSGGGTISYDYAQPMHGKVTGTAPSVTYTPKSGYTGEDSFRFTATAGGKTSAPGTIELNVAAAATPTKPAAPTANSQRPRTIEDQAIAIKLSGVPAAGGALSFSVTTSPKHGTLSGTAPDLTYTPNNKYVGADSFEFTVTEGGQTSQPASVSIIVEEAPDTAGENSKWFKAFNDPVGTEAELVKANNALRDLNEAQFWTMLWQITENTGASVSMQARLAKHVAVLMPAQRNYGADIGEKVARKGELLQAGTALATQLLVGFDAQKTTALRASFKVGYDSLSTLRFSSGDNSAVPRQMKLWVLAYALNQVMIKQGAKLTTTYNPYVSPNNRLTMDQRLQKITDPLNGAVFLLLRPSSVDIDKVEYSVDGNKIGDTRALYFPQRLDTTTLTTGSHTLGVSETFVATSGKPAATNSVAFDVDNT
ncbi:MAG: Ig-like domain-containing protein [Pseudomonadota bacterium]